MTTISRYAHLPVDPRPWKARATDWPESTLRPFTPGDVLVGATLLNEPADDHAGRGRILQFDQRAFSKVHFMADQTLLFTEILDGMSGSMAVTHSVLSADQTRLFYVSETGTRLMQFDLANGRQLPDLRRGADGDRTMMHFDLSLTPDGTLMVCMGNRVDALTQDGALLRSYVLPGFGWASIDARSGTCAYVCNWFSGEVVKLDLGTGEIVAREIVAEKCMAGIAQYLP